MDAAGFADSVRAEAAMWDAAGQIPADVRRTMAGAGLLGADLPAEYGGLGVTPAELGELSAQVGGVCSALRGLVTVTGMVGAALHRWGTREQRADWLPALVSGEHVAGFAATEAEAGSDLAAVGTLISPDGEGFTVTGRKLWVTCGEIASVFLVLGMLDGRPATVLVEADRAGVLREPVRGQLGMRAAQIAHVQFDRVSVPRSNLVAPAGFGLSHVVATALDHGRFTVAWGCLGMAETCLRLAVRHAAGRTQRGVALADHQPVRSLLARASVDVRAAREICLRAARLRDERSLQAVLETMVAKYLAARTAASVSHTAVQVCGASGCAPDSTAGRFFRDAKVMEIIEGTELVAESYIAGQLFREVA
jgi:methoxymalonate biosynthesis protein